MKELLVKIVALLEIVGGAIGFMMIFASTIFNLHKVWGTPQLDSPVLRLKLLIAVIFVVLFVFVVRAGILLYRDERKGYILSVVFQALQVPFVATKYFIYNFVVAFQLQLGIVLDKGQYHFYHVEALGSKYMLWFATPVELAVSVNVVAVTALIILVDAMRNTKNKKIS